MKIAVARGRPTAEPVSSYAAYVAALGDRGATVNTPIWNEAPIGDFLDADLVVLGLAVDYASDPGGFAAWLASLSMQSARILNDPWLALWNNDRRYILSLAATGIPTPETTALPIYDAEAVKVLADAMRAVGHEALVIKPVFGSTRALRVSEARSPDEALSAARAGSPGAPLLLQTLPPTPNEGAWTLVFLGGSFSHAVCHVETAQTPSESGVKDEASAKAAFVSRSAPPTAVGCARRVLAVLGRRTLFARIDGVMQGGQFLCTALDLTGPELYLQHCPGAAHRMADLTLAMAAGRGR